MSVLARCQGEEEKRKALVYNDPTDIKHTHAQYICDPLCENPAKSFF